MQENTCMQLELDFSPPVPFESLLLSRNIHNVTVTTSKRLRRSWHGKWEKHNNALFLTVPIGIADAPHLVKNALIDWVLLLSKTPKDLRNSKLEKKKLEQLIFNYFKENGLAKPRASRFDPSLFITQGRIYDLRDVFNRVNKEYFNSEIISYVRWGQNRYRSYQMNQHDAYGNRFSIITIASVYNKRFVPDFAIDGIMYHEMLHIAVPPMKRQFRNIIHGAEFKRREQLYKYYSEWTSWEKTAHHRFF